MFRCWVRVQNRNVPFLAPYSALFLSAFRRGVRSLCIYPLVLPAVSGRADVSPAQPLRPEGRRCPEPPGSVHEALTDTDLDRSFLPPFSKPRNQRYPIG